MPDFKLLPMGIADFRRIRIENYYYVDKTAWIPKFELVSSFLFFCRPRRFGKTLMLSVMESYYDCKQTADWDRLFGGLWIHEHPTAERGKFQVMRLDFSQVTGTIDELKPMLDSYMDIMLNSFEPVAGGRDATTPIRCRKPRSLDEPRHAAAPHHCSVPGSEATTPRRLGKVLRLWLVVSQPMPIVSK